MYKTNKRYIPFFPLFCDKKYLNRLIYFYFESNLKLLLISIYPSKNNIEWKMDITKDKKKMKKELHKLMMVFFYLL